MNLILHWQMELLQSGRMCSVETTGAQRGQCTCEGKNVKKIILQQLDVQLENY